MKFTALTHKGPLDFEFDLKGVYQVLLDGDLYSLEENKRIEANCLQYRSIVEGTNTFGMYPITDCEFVKLVEPDVYEYYNGIDKLFEESCDKYDAVKLYFTNQSYKNQVCSYYYKKYLEGYSYLSTAWVSSKIESMISTLTNYQLGH